MVFWCKNCGALMGLREPIADWSTNRNALCPSCLEKEAKEAAETASKKPTQDAADSQAESE